MIFLENRKEATSKPPSLSKPPRIVAWTILTATIGGVLGLVGLDIPFFATYMELPPPLLGTPIGYQTFVTCNAGPYSVCAPNVQNNVLVASVDFVICFAIAFVISFAILRGLLSSLASPNVWKRNALPAVLLVIALLLVSLTATASVRMGASLSQPHWPAPSGVQIYPLNVTIYSGSASFPSSQGTAHMNLILGNNYWTDLNVSILVALTGQNVTNPVPVYQCVIPTLCKPFSSTTVPPYTALGLNTTSTALYFGTAIQSGANYRYDLNMTAEGLISQGNVTAI